MALPNTIEIKFEAKGDKVLIQTIKSLDKATKSLIQAQSSLVGEGKKKIGVDKANLNSLRKLNVELKLQGKSLKAVGLDTNLYSQALKGNKLAMAKIRVATKKYNLSLKKTKKGILETAHSTRILGGSFAVLRSKMLLVSFGASLVAMTIGRLVKAQGEQELAEKKLSTAIGKRSNELLKFASAQQDVTTFGDEETITAMSLVGAYTDNEEAIKSLTSASMDLASAKGMDLNTAVDLVAKSVFSSTNALSRYGVVVEGDVGSTERLAMATQALGNMYGGQAKAQADTMTGSLKQMGNAVGDTGEALGNLLAPVIIGMAKVFEDGAKQATKFFTQMKNIIDFGNVIGKLDSANEESLNARIEANKIIINDLISMKVRKGQLNDHEKDSLENAQHFLKIDKQKLAVLVVTREQMEKIAIADADRQESIDRWGESRLTLDEFVKKQQKMVDLKAQEVLHMEVLRENYPELAKAVDALNKKVDPSVENMKKLADFSAKTASAFISSALMGDSLRESIKRSIVQMLVMVVQAKLLEYFTRKTKEHVEAISTGGGSTIVRGIMKVADFLFGHEGGEVTANGIKRFHAGGLANDEVPAVLQQGEFVLSKQAVDTIGLGAVRSMNEGGGGAITNVYIQGGIVQEDYVTNELLPAINKARALA